MIKSVSVVAEFGSGEKIIHTQNIFLYGRPDLEQKIAGYSKCCGKKI